MKVALSTDAADLAGVINPAFGRCRRFLIYDTVTGNVETVDNPGYGATGGAGVFAARLLVERSVDRVITGQVGSKARPILEKAGIAIEENRSGSLHMALSASPATTAVPASDKPAATSICPVAGQCVCERCGYRKDDEGLPCFQQRCPACGTLLERRMG